MSQPSLLEIVPEQLFQTHSISDIDQVQKKLQYEIERKREELRAMVGLVPSYPEKSLVCVRVRLVANFTLVTENGR